MFLEILERAFYISVGGIIGYILRGFHEAIREIKEELDEVDEHVKHRQNDAGFITPRTVRKIALALAVALCAWAAIATQITNNTLEDTQGELVRVSYCNQQYLKAQADFLQTYLEQPPPTDSEKEEELRAYLKVLDAFIDATDKYSSSEPYNLPENLTLEACLTSIAKENQDG